MDKRLVERVENALSRFVAWLDSFGETSYDHQTFFASPIGGKAKQLYYKEPLLGTLSVAPMIFCEAFVPQARRLFWKKQRFPIADAHYAMGFTLLAELYQSRRHYDRALHFLEVLKETRSPRFLHYCWGYPFDWVTRGGTVYANTPLITTTPYVYEAYAYAYAMDKNPTWRNIMHSIATHAASDIGDIEFSPESSSCSYFPNEGKGGVVNASAYRAFLLAKSSQDFANGEFQHIAIRNLNFVLQCQQPNGSWYYAVDSVRDFVDHYHTCFVLKALAKIEQITGHTGCQRAIERGVNYYVENLFDDKGLPKPFSKPPRLTVYRRELYDYAECINLGVLLRGRFPRLDERVDHAVEDVLIRWQKDDGSFRSRELLLGWDNIPMHRWAQAQLFRSLCFLLHQEYNSN